MFFSPTLIEEEEEWIDAKDFKHILDLRHKIRPFLLKNSRFFVVKDATFPSQRCYISLSKMPPFLVKGTLSPFPRWSLSYQRCLLSVSEIGLPPVKYGTCPCPIDLSLLKMLSFPFKDGAFLC